MNQRWSGTCAVVSVAMIGAVLLACKGSGNTTSVDAGAVNAAALPVAPPPKKEPTLSERLAETANLNDALVLLRSSFKDTQGENDPAALVLAVWASKNLTWQQLLAVPETKHALIMKDPEAERGKRNCYTGVIVEIQVDRSAGTPIYLGGIMTGSGQIARFAAVGSTGELVQNSGGRFCGVVTGRYSYENAGGGTTHAVFLVGMFDLPENKKAATATPG